MRKLTLLAAPLVVLGCAALPDLEEVKYAGVSFAYDPDDFAGITIKQEPKRTAPDMRSFVDEGFAPERVCFYLKDKRPLPALAEGPRYFFPARSFLCVIPLEDASVEDFGKAYPALHHAAMRLRKMLRERSGKPERRRTVPDVPANNAGFSVLGRFQYLEFRSGSGILLLTQYSQEITPNPINNEELTLSFQGLTQDGQYYVAARLAITHPSLPGGIDFTGQIVRDRQWRYLSKAEKALEGFPEESFQPSLKSLKALFSSIRVE
jgi:hypothetical protein